MMLIESLVKIALILTSLISPAGTPSTCHLNPGGSIVTGSRGESISVDQAQTQRRRKIRWRRRHTGKRVHPMPEQSKDSTPSDAQPELGPTGPKKIDEVKPSQTPPPTARRPKRRYDPVAQPPEKPPVP